MTYEDMFTTTEWRLYPQDNANDQFLISEHLNGVDVDINFFV